MVMVRKRRLLACLALCAALTLILAACSDAALFGLFKSKSSKSPVIIRHSLVVFPFDRDTEIATSVPDRLVIELGEYLRSTLAPSKDYSVLLYEERLTPVQRAKTDNAIKDQETKAPFFADKTKAGKLADILASDYYMIGSVESYTYDKEKKVAEITLKADLVDSKTGKVKQEFVVGGSADAGSEVKDESELQSIAAGRAVEALRDKLLSASENAETVVPKPNEVKK